MLLTCIKCGTPTSPQLDLGDADTFYCPDCEEQFTLAEVEQMIGDWQKVINWVKLCPARQPDASQPTGDPITDRIIRSVRGEGPLTLNAPGTGRAFPTP
jgi:hypothetical protein